MLRSLSTLALLAILLTGCADSAFTDGSGAATLGAAAPSAVASAKYGPPTCNGAASLNGPNWLFYSTSAVYSVSMGNGCTINNVLWSITSGDATLSPTSGTSTTVTSGSQTFTIRARIVYNTDNIVTVTKTVTVGPASVSVDAYNYNFGIRIAWSALPVSPTYCTITRAVKNRFTGALGTPVTWEVTTNPYFDGGYIFTSNGPFLISYDFKAYDGPATNRRLIGSGGDGGIGDTSY